MSVRAFFDTNIMIYRYADNEQEKQAVSREIVNNAAECVVSTQILNEMNNVMIKKWRMTIEAIKTVQGDIRRINKVAHIGEDTIDKAIDLNARYKFSYYDCLMLASALENDCGVIYTEDMNDSQIIDNTLKIVNPFRIT